MIQIVLMLVLAQLEASAQAGVVTTSHFVQPGQWAIGFEPELILTNGAGVGGNMRFTQGITDLNNVTGIIGTGSGPRLFRVGANMTFDLFPDIDAQPGIGIAGQAMYYRLKGNADQVELTVLPYFHKTFQSGGTEIEPYTALPIGMAFLNGQYQGISQIVLGTMIKNTENIRYSMELGLAINNTETYFSAGVTYFH